MSVAMADVQVLPVRSSPQTKTDYQFEEVENAKPLPQPDNMNGTEEVEPEIHARTWIALGAFLLLNYTQVLALQGPSAVVSAGGPKKNTASHCDENIIDKI